MRSTVKSIDIYYDMDSKPEVQVILRGADPDKVVKCKRYTCKMRKSVSFADVRETCKGTMYTAA